MNYPKDIPNRYALNGEVVPPPYRVIAGFVDSEVSCYDPTNIREPEFEKPHVMFLKCRNEKTYKKALTLLEDLTMDKPWHTLIGNDGKIAGFYGMRSDCKVYIQLTGS